MFKNYLNWAISSRVPKLNCEILYGEGSTTILYGVESNDSKCRGSSRTLEERDIVWSPVKIGAAYNDAGIK